MLIARLIQANLLSARLLTTRADVRLDQTCWPDFSAHYIACCTEEVPPDPHCFTEGRTFSRCCRCKEEASRKNRTAMRHNTQSNANLAIERDAAKMISEKGTFSMLGLELSQAFFGPLLCCGPSAISRLDDFLISDQQGKQRPIRIFVYNLHRRFNADLINRLQLGGWTLGTECDYGLTACTESQWNGLFSVYRQFATEVVVLLKILAAPPGVLTANPDEADLFVVPYLAKTDCAEAGNAGRDPCWGKCKCATAVKHLFAALPHYRWNTRGRHLFLATGDMKDLPVEIQAQPLVISLGASFCGGHLVVPSPNLDPILQPGGAFEVREAAGKAPDRHIFAYWFGSIDKEWREKVTRQLKEYGEKPNARTVVIHDIGSDYLARDIWQTDASSPAFILEEMIRSVFCPVIQGDVPHQKRLFDSILTGCIPVVVGFPSHVSGEVSWWLPGGPPIERMVPFPADIDYQSFVLEVPVQVVEKGLFVEVLLQVSDDEIKMRQDAMRRVRNLIRFDLQGTGPDAFSLTMKNVVRFLQRSQQLASPTTQHSFGARFDCGVPPSLDLGGTQMYGHFACCLLDENRVDE